MQTKTYKFIYATFIFVFVCFSLAVFLEKFNLCKYVWIVLAVFSSGWILFFAVFAKSNKNITYRRDEKIAEELKNENQNIISQIEEKEKSIDELLDVNKKLIRKNEEIEKQSQELSLFNTSVAHDLRAPLRHINGYIYLLDKNFRDTLPSEAIHYMDIISGSAKHMGMLIDAILRFSKFGMVNIDLAPTDMNKIINDLILEINQDNPNCHIDWVIDTKLPVVLCDSALIRIVWKNLFSNAVKFSKKREKPRVEVGVRVEKNEYIFFVRDNGIGFDMQYANNLFGLFQRLHSSEEFEGLGIGLSIINRIILRHNGRVWVEAMVDEGAIFYFSLPISEEVTV